MNLKWEYGIARNPNDYVIPSATLTDAIQHAKNAGPDWIIVERAVTKWEEVSA